MNSTENTLADKKVVLSGGSTGIGRATVQKLTLMGAHVITFARHEKELQETLDDIKKEKGEIFGFVADVSRPEDMAKIFKTVDALFGKVDILINNASISAGSALDTSEDDLDYIMSVNLTAYLKMTQECVKRMESGHIVNIGSISSKLADPDSDLYVATKAGVEGFSNSLRKKVNGRGIQVTLIRPGLTNTDLHYLTPEQRTEFLEKQMLLNADDVADAVIFALTRPENCEVMQIDIKPSKLII